jgi:GntR family transcriptional regulator
MQKQCELPRRHDNVLPVTSQGGKLDPDDPVPLYQQLADLLGAAIRSGELAGRMPSAVQLAEQFQCSRDTVLRALAILKAQGLVTTSHGRGSFTAKRLATTTYHHLSLPATLA